MIDTNSFTFNVNFTRYPLSGEPAGLPSDRVAGGGGAVGTPLVKNTKSVHAKACLFDKKTGEIQAFSADDECVELRATSDAISFARNERYRLQTVARDILSANPRRVINEVDPEFLQGDAEGDAVASADVVLNMAPVGRVSPGVRPWRVINCTRAALDDVHVMLSAEHRSAHYKNLMVCGSVWTCPVCSSKISSRRAAELTAATEMHIDAGGSLLMVTLTFSHSRQDDLSMLLGDSARSTGLSAALRRFRNSRSYKKVKKDLELLGIVRALEVTYGNANGWHPHIHELWFLPKHISRRGQLVIKTALFAAWRDACIKSELSPPNRQRGLDLREAWTAGEYLAKFGNERGWSPSLELTAAHSKKGRNKSMTPFDILRAVQNNSAKVDFYRQLFVDYANAFFGRAQIFWSRGLKALFAIDDISDEVIAAENDDAAILVTTIPKVVWKLILSLDYDARSSILSLAEVGGASAVNDFINSINPKV